MKGCNVILWNLVPEKWRKDAFIAGGYAACPAMASDIDLWIFVDDCGGKYPLADVRKEVLAHIRSEGVYINEEDEASQTDYEGVNVNILKVGVVPYGTKIHVMVVDAPVHPVLCGFDISTHQIALLPSGEVILGQEWTPITAPPKVLIDTDRTAARLEKITNRYRRVDGKAA
jgi:hypothetical protein